MYYKTCLIGVMRWSSLLLSLCLIAHASAASQSQVSSEKILPSSLPGAGVSLPSGVSMHAEPDGTHYLKIPAARAKTLVRPAVKERAILMADWAKNTDIVAVMNGGFFIGDKPVSLVVRDGNVLAENIAQVTRSGKQLSVRRSAFWMDADGNAHVDWVARDSDGRLSIFPEPLPYRVDQPELASYAPAISGQHIHPLWAIGGGPRLVKDGAVYVSYDEEVFWGSGVTLEDARPRSAICITVQRDILLYITPSARLNDLAVQLQGQGCRDAMNLDGGGSSAMYVAGEKVLDQERPVPAVLTVVSEAPVRALP